MLSLFYELLKLGRTVVHASKDTEFRVLCLTMSVLLLSGTVFYVHAEGWSIVDALYFCVMTMSTIGYGDLAPSSGLSKIFTIVYSILSIGVFVAIVSKLTASMLDGRRHIARNESRLD